jgi:hypothetical protein
MKQCDQDNESPEQSWLVILQVASAERQQRSPRQPKVVPASGLLTEDTMRLQNVSIMLRLQIRSDVLM